MLTYAKLEALWSIAVGDSFKEYSFDLVTGTISPDKYILLLIKTVKKNFEMMCDPNASGPVVNMRSQIVSKLGLKATDDREKAEYLNRYKEKFMKKAAKFENEFRKRKSNPNSQSDSSISKKLDEVIKKLKDIKMKLD